MEIELGISVGLARVMARVQSPPTTKKKKKIRNKRPKN